MTRSRQMDVVLYGYQYSVYTWIARACLHELDVKYTYRETDPFSENPDTEYALINPFGNVPTLNHDGFQLFETRVITQYLSEQFEGTHLLPDNAKSMARLNQIIAITDNYGYWPMIRQVFAQRIFASAEGETPNESEITDGLEKSKPVLAELNKIAEEKLQLNGNQFSLADLHLVPMISYFAIAPEGRQLLADYTALGNWWQAMHARPCFTETQPAMPTTKSF